MLPHYLEKLILALHQVDIPGIVRVIMLFEKARRKEKTVYVFGNGGSASTANHFANDLVKLAGSIDCMRSIEAVSLCANVAPLTALANDISYDAVFSEQLLVFGKPGDVAFGISCSGTSPNVVKALGVAKNSLSMGTVLLTGNRPSNLADNVLMVNSDDIRIQEDVHLAICHMIAGELRDKVHSWNCT